MLVQTAKLIENMVLKEWENPEINCDEEYRAAVTKKEALYDQLKGIRRIDKELVLQIITELEEAVTLENFYVSRHFFTKGLQTEICFRQPLASQIDLRLNEITEKDGVSK